MPPLFRTRRRVEFADTDMVGLVHFANYFRYMEAAEVEMLRSLGLSVARLEAEGGHAGFPRRAASCEYLGPARFDEVLDVEVRVQRLGRTSVTYGFEFTREGRPVARGQITAVCCRVAPESVEAVEIPPAVRRRLE
jgi:YbgC/YbaW family acyl-CoA thioester hydrolase